MHGGVHMHPLKALAPPNSQHSLLRQPAGGAGRRAGAPSESTSQGAGVPGQVLLALPGMSLALLGAPLALLGQCDWLQGASAC